MFEVRGARFEGKIGSQGVILYSEAFFKRLPGLVNLLSCYMMVLPSCYCRCCQLVCSSAQQASSMTVYTQSSCRPARRSAISIASGIAVLLCLVAAAESFIVPARAMPVANGLKTSSSAGSISAAIESPGNCDSSIPRAGGATLKPGSVRRREWGCMAAAVDGIASTVVGVLGPNQGVLTEEQRKMASTLLDLGQV